MSWQKDVQIIDQKADKILAGWTFEALAANLFSS